MTVKEIKSALNIIAAIAAFIAAAMWYRASVAIVRPTNSLDQDGCDAQITMEHATTGKFDPFLTGIEQSRLNKWGALSASVAALIQGIVLLIPD